MKNKKKNIECIKPTLNIMSNIPKVFDELEIKLRNINELMKKKWLVSLGFVLHFTTTNLNIVC